MKEPTTLRHDPGIGYACGPRWDIYFAKLNQKHGKIIKEIYIQCKTNLI